MLYISSERCSENPRYCCQLDWVQWEMNKENYMRISSVIHGLNLIVRATIGPARSSEGQQLAVCAAPRGLYFTLIYANQSW